MGDKKRAWLRQLGVTSLAPDGGRPGGAPGGFPDGGPTADAGTPDAGVPDGGTPSDSGVPNGAKSASSAPDGGTPASAAADGGTPGTGGADAGAADGGTKTPEQQEDEDFEKLAAKREGRRNDVYLDSESKPTVGIGHLVRPEDKLKVGDKITDEQVAAFFKKDSATAMTAARSQVAEAGIKDTAFVAYLASANFQLGTDWTTTFKNTWKMIVDGKYEDAAKALDGTTWSKQTPVRVKDFQDALRALPAKPAP